MKLIELGRTLLAVFFCSRSKPLRPKSSRQYMRTARPWHRSIQRRLCWRAVNRALGGRRPIAGVCRLSCDRCMSCVVRMLRWSPQRWATGRRAWLSEGAKLPSSVRSRYNASAEHTGSMNTTVVLRHSRYKCNLPSTVFLARTAANASLNHSHARRQPERYLNHRTTLDLARIRSPAGVGASPPGAHSTAWRRPHLRTQRHRDLLASD